MLLTTNNVILGTVLFAFLLPLLLMLWWKARSGARISAFITGAFCFVIFAMVLENILHQYCLIEDNAVSRTITNSPLLYSLYAAFAAGIFEETGRLFGFKVLLRKHRERSCAVMYGIGHGGIEVMILLGTPYLLYLLALSGVQIASAETTELLAQTARSIQPLMCGIAMLERISALMIHIGLSMLVFRAAKDKKSFWLYPLAILLHAMVDAPAALYQYQYITSIEVVEICAFAMGIICLILGKIAMKHYKA